jgi:hypothetical protein
VKYLCSIVLLIFLAQFSFAQKTNIETVQYLMVAEKFEEAYAAITSEKFKKTDKEGDVYHYLYAGICQKLYIKNPTMNSAYRNEGTLHAAYLLLSNSSEMAAQGRQMVDYFTIRIYNDIVMYLNSVPESDSIKFDSCSTETLVSFQLFTIPDDWDQKVLYFMGSSFYNDAVFLQQSINVEDPIDLVMEKSERCMALFGNARNCFEKLCNKFQVNCEVLEGLKPLFED